MIRTEVRGRTTHLHMLHNPEPDISQINVVIDDVNGNDLNHYKSI